MDGLFVMTTQRVQIYEIEGVEVEKNQRRWCGVISTDCVRTVCGHALDAFRDVEFTEKNVNRGGITCEFCLDLIKQHKAIKL